VFAFTSSVLDKAEKPFFRFSSESIFVFFSKSASLCSWANFRPAIESLVLFYRLVFFVFQLKGLSSIASSPCFISASWASSFFVQLFSFFLLFVRVYFLSLMSNLLQQTALNQKTCQKNRMF
jgi:hypothetical protein